MDEGASRQMRRPRHGHVGRGKGKIKNDAATPPGVSADASTGMWARLRSVPAGNTLALSAGVSPKLVSEQLGHASVAFTLEVYSHVLPHMQDTAAMKVEALLTGA